MGQRVKQGLDFTRTLTRGNAMLRDALNFVRPPEDASWKTVNRWRWNVSLTLLVLVILSGVAEAPVGGMRHVRAAELDDRLKEAIDTAVTEKVNPVAQKVQTVESKVDRMSELLLESLANTLASQIRTNISKRCKTTGWAEREELNREKDRLQANYRSYKGEFYREPSCSDL
jgi:hypothetical protein